MTKHRNPARPFTLRANNLRGGLYEFVSNDAEWFNLDFAEFYVGDWFGMERMDHRSWSISIGDVTLSVAIPEGSGKPVRVVVVEGDEQVESVRSSGKR